MTSLAHCCNMVAMQHDTADLPTNPSLNRDDLRAMRSANYLQFTHDSDADEMCIEAVREFKEDGYDRKARRPIFCTSHIRAFNGLSEEHGTYRASAHMNVRFDTVMETVLSLLKVGDRLSLLWYRANDTELLREAHLSCDELRLCVQRGEKKLTFLLLHRTDRENGLCRMTREVSGS